MNPDELKKLVERIARMLETADGSSAPRTPFGTIGSAVRDIPQARRSIGAAERGNIPVPQHLIEALDRPRVTRADKIIGRVADFTPVAGAEAFRKGYHNLLGGAPGAAALNAIEGALALAPFPGGKIARPVVESGAAQALAHIADAEVASATERAVLPEVLDRAVRPNHLAPSNAAQAVRAQMEDAARAARAVAPAAARRGNRAFPSGTGMAPDELPEPFPGSHESVDQARIKAAGADSPLWHSKHMPEPAAPRADAPMGTAEEEWAKFDKQYGNVAADSVAAHAPESIAGASIRIGGKTFGGENHGFAYNAAREAGLDPDVLPFEDGFTTSSGRFVTRDEAYDIADRSAQLARRHSSKQLVAEELKAPKIAGDSVVARAAKGHPEIQNILREMQQTSGSPNLPRITAIDPEKGKQLAKAYEALPVNDPKARASYDALNREVAAQKKRLEDAGFKFEFVDHDPYKNSKEMMADVAENRRLKVFKTSADQSHPYMTADQNNDFRAVHDKLAHAGEGHQFGPVGEENAYRVHASTLSPEALPALASETRGQNSYVNFGPNAHLPASERGFAPQKAALFPQHLTGDYDAMVEPARHAFEHYSPQTDLTRLDPNFAGTGLAGAERKRPGRVNMMHVYDAGSKPERQFANLPKYQLDVEGSIYDIAKDPDGIVKRLQQRVAAGKIRGIPGDELERDIQKAGHAGYFNSETYPNIKKLFGAHDVRADDWSLAHAPAAEAAAPARAAASDLPPQTDLRRHIGARTSPQRLSDIRQETFNTMTSPSWEQMLREGKFPDWYMTGGVEQKAVDALGDSEGHEQFGRLMDLMGSTTARSDPDNNLRRAGYYRALDLAGLLDPEALRAGAYKKVPKGMGHLANDAHHASTARLLEDGYIDSILNPKPASFTGNLKRNFRPWTGDTRMTTGLAMFNPNLVELGGIVRKVAKDGSVGYTPRDWAYAAMEKGAQDAAQVHAGRGLFDVPSGADPTAFDQALGWDALGSRIPGSSRSQGTFSDVFNAKLAKNAQAWGVSEDEANKLYWAGNPFDLPLNKRVMPAGLFR